MGMPTNPVPCPEPWPTPWFVWIHEPRIAWTRGIPAPRSLRVGGKRR